jgi:GTP-binding protein EngB required for normal cell division
MRDALVGLLDKVDTALAESTGVLDASSLEDVSRSAGEARLRLSYPEEVVVVALAGGTGSGKSSLLNAIVGDEVSLTGGIRPMTVSPLALVPAQARASFDGYLDALGIAERVDHHGPTWLCLIDLPDNDSVELDHLHQTAQLISRVDMIVWVTDPEKYRDAALHRGSIAPLSAYQRQFLFVLNQIDRIDEGDVRAVVEDLAEALLQDGIVEPTIIVTSAQPVAGPPIGVDLVVEHLEQGLSQTEKVHQKLLTDLTAAAGKLVERSAGARGVDFESRWQLELVGKVDLALQGKVADAGHDLASFVAGMAAEVEGETAERLREIALELPARFLECATEVLTSSSAQVVEAGSWWGRLTGQRVAYRESPGLRDDLQSAVDRAIGDPIRDLFSLRNRANAAITDLALAAGHLERLAT